MNHAYNVTMYLSQNDSNCITLKEIFLYTRNIRHIICKIGFKRMNLHVYIEIVVIIYKMEKVVTYV